MKQKVLYGVGIGITILAYLFFETDILGFLLAYELIMIPLLYSLALYLSRKGKATIVIPYFHAQKEQEFLVEVHLKNTSVLPMSSVRVLLNCVNEFTGEHFPMEEHAMVDAKGKSIVQFYLQSGCCGKLKIGIERIWVQDYLRLFSKEMKQEKMTDELMILPTFHKIFIQNSSHNAGRYQLEQYSHVKSGEDTSEVFDVHTYRPGDTMQKMHWKLTAKTNEYLVKEFSLPVEHVMFLFLDLSCENVSDYSIEDFDGFLEILASLSWSMVEQRMSHIVIWKNVKEQNISMICVEYEKDVYDMLEQVCDSKLYEEYVDVQKLYELKNVQAEIKESLRLDAKGRFYRNDICIKEFDRNDVEKELMEWKPEI